MKEKKSLLKTIKFFILVGLVACLAWVGYRFYYKYVLENKILKEMIFRLEADSRIAEVLVTRVEENSTTGEKLTTIKFLEYDSQGKPLTPQRFTFSNNIIQFQSLVVRFDDIHIRHGDALRGKSAYLFWKVFTLAGPKTQEFDITKMNEVPAGYKTDFPRNAFEEKLWREFWDYALNSKKAKIQGIKNVQIEAPGTRFVPGILYTLKIEHDGGIRIDTIEIPAVLKGETIPEG